MINDDASVNYFFGTNFVPSFIENSGANNNNNNNSDSSSDFFLPQL